MPSNLAFKKVRASSKRAPKPHESQYSTEMVGYAVVVLLVLDGPEVLFRHESALYTLGWADMFWWCLSQP
jgi:hypothetical protein